MHHRHLGIAVFCTFALVVMALPSAAQIELRFDPADTTVALGDSFQLSIVLDEAQAVRSFEVWLQYDSSTLTFIGGEPGLAFVESGCQLFDGVEEDTPGTLQGYVVVMGAECWMTGPGELFVWEFTGSAAGIVQIGVDDVALYAPQIGELADVSLDCATVEVRDPSAVSGLLPITFSLGNCWPNPFNPMTTIRYDLPKDARVNLRIYDIAGRLVKALVNGEVVEAGRKEAVWRGRNNSGCQVAAGVYFYKLETGQFSDTKRMTLVK